MQLIGQEANLDIINRWEKLPQFIIISGDEHTGKTNLVLYLCKKFGLYYRKMNNSIKDVRRLLDVMSENSKTVYHFKNFHKASIQARNALLKITEEPVRGNYIIITGSSQLKTLESRARRLIMAPYTQDEMEQYMKKYYINEELIHNLYICGFNTPAKVEMYSKYDSIESLLQYVLYIYERITYMNSDELICMLPRFDTRYEGIDACLLFFNMLINLIEYNIKEQRHYSYFAILDILIKNKNDLLHEETLNRRFLLYRTFYEIEQLGRSQEL